MDQRIAQQLAVVNSGIEKNQRLLRRVAVAELAAQRERILQYQALARLAVARLYDVGTTEALR